MSDATSKGGGQNATPPSKDDEIVTISKSSHDMHMRNAFIVGNLSRTYDTPVEKLIPFFEQYGIQERTALLDDLNEAGEIHHSVYDYRIEELTVLRDAGTNTRILNDKQEVEEDK